MKVIQARSFARAVKKMHPNQKRALNDAICAIMTNPEIGDIKKGDLAGLRVYKYKVLSQQYLLGYRFEADQSVVILVAIGPHENFYQNVKRD